MNSFGLVTLCLCTLCGSHIAVQLPMVCMASEVQGLVINPDTGNTEQETKCTSKQVKGLYT